MAWLVSQELDISNQLIADVYEMFFFPLYNALSKSSKKHRSKKQHLYSVSRTENRRKTLVIRISGVRLPGKNGQWRNLSELMNIKVPGFASTT